MSTSSPQQTPVATPETPAKAPLVRPYLGYVGYFVGAGMISGGIVHYPLNPTYYAILVAAGVTLFLAATILNEIVLSTTPVSTRRLVRLVGASLFLSFGIGMFSGGIQHFTDFPERAATLIPLGVALSFGAYILRNGWGGQHRRVVVVGALVIAFSAMSFFVLQAVAERVGGAGHDHAAAGLPFDSPART